MGLAEKLLAAALLVCLFDFVNVGQTSLAALSCWSVLVCSLFAVFLFFFVKCPHLSVTSFLKCDRTSGFLHWDVLALILARLAPFEKVVDLPRSIYVEDLTSGSLDLLKVLEFGCQKVRSLFDGLLEFFWC